MRRHAFVIIVLAIANLGQAPAVKGGTVTGTVEVKGSGKVDELWAYLVNTTTKVHRPGKGKTERIEQRERDFRPRTLVVPIGATVYFPNQDSEEHNVFSHPKKATNWLGFNLGRYNTDPVGRSQRFGRAGEFDIYCDLHPDMVAAVKVVPSVHITKVVDGTYTFTDVPPGQYRVVAWAPSRAESSTDVLVQAGKTMRVKPFPFMPAPWSKTHKRFDETDYKVYP